MKTFFHGKINESTKNIEKTNIAKGERRDKRKTKFLLLAMPNCLLYFSKYGGSRELRQKECMCFPSFLPGVLPIKKEEEKGGSHCMGLSRIASLSRSIGCNRYEEMMHLYPKTCP